MTSLSSRQIEHPALAPSTGCKAWRRQAAAAAGGRGARSCCSRSFPSIRCRCCSMAACISRHPASPASFNLYGYRQVLTWQSAVLFANTVGISLPKTIISLTLAVLFGLDHRAHRHAGTWRAGGPDHAAILLPPILTAMAWGMLQSSGRRPQSALAVGHRLGHRAGKRLFLWRRGLAHAAIFRAVPVLVRRGSLPRDGPAPEEARCMCGASRRRTFRRVTFALMLPATVTAISPQLHPRVEKLRVAAVLRLTGEIG